MPLPNILLRLNLYLLNLRRGAPEQLYVPRPDDFPVLLQRSLCLFLAAKEHEGVPGGTAVALLHEQNAVLAVQHVARTLAAHEERQLMEQNRECNIRFEVITVQYV